MMLRLSCQVRVGQTVTRAQLLLTVFVKNYSISLAPKLSLFISSLFRWKWIHAQNLFKVVFIIMFLHISFLILLHFYILNIITLAKGNSSTTTTKTVIIANKMQPSQRSTTKSFRTTSSSFLPPTRRRKQSC